MADLQHRTSRKIANGNSFSAKNVYDDVFGGPPKFTADSFGTQIDDYGEIFGRFSTSGSNGCSSLPVLDFPVHDGWGEDGEVSGGSLSSTFAYSDIFGGLDWGDFAGSYEELFGGEAKGLRRKQCREKDSKKQGDSSSILSKNTWTPAETKSWQQSPAVVSSICMEEPEGVPVARVERTPFLSHVASDPLYVGPEKTMSFLNTNKKSKEDALNGTTDTGQSRSISGFTCGVDVFSSLQKSETDPTLSQVIGDTVSVSSNEEILEEKEIRNPMSPNPVGNNFSKTSPGSKMASFAEVPSNACDQHHSHDSDNDLRCDKDMFITVSEINLRTQPSRVPPPARPPPKLVTKEGVSEKPMTGKVKVYADKEDLHRPVMVNHHHQFDGASKTRVVEEVANQSSPPFFDVEVDASSAAAASSAAMKEAMERAEARLKSAKHSMERKRDIKGRENGDIKGGERMGHATASAHENHVNQEEAAQEVCRGEDRGTKDNLRDERQRTAKLVQAPPDFEEKERQIDFSQESTERECGEVFGEAHEQGKKSGEWRAGKSFYEWEDHEKKFKAAREVFEQGKKEKKMSSAKEDRMRDENEKKKKESKEAHEHEEIEKKLKAAQDALAREESEKKLKAAQEAHEQKENERKLKLAQEALKREENDRKLKLVQEALEQEENERKAREREESEMKLKLAQEAREQKENERKLKLTQEAREREENERKLKLTQEACKREENEKLKLAQEAREREGNERRLKPVQEACKREEYERKLKLAQEAHERKENERKLKLAQEACEREDNERKLKLAQEARELEENERQKKVAQGAREWEENERKLKLVEEIHEVEANERKPILAQEACEQEENMRTLKLDKVATKQEENQGELKLPRETREREDTERELKLAQDAREREENESKLKLFQEVQEREENERKLKWAQEVREQEENERKLKISQEDCRWKENENELVVDQWVYVQEQKNKIPKQYQESGESEETESKMKNIEMEDSKREHAEKVRVQQEREKEKERQRKIEEEKVREHEREKDRIAVERATRKARERAFAEVQERVSAEARERAERAFMESRRRTERAAVERATAEARTRAIEKALAEKATLEERERAERSVAEKFVATLRDRRQKDNDPEEFVGVGTMANGGMRQNLAYTEFEHDLQFQSTFSSSGTFQRYPDASNYGFHSVEKFQEAEGESAKRRKAKLERQQRTDERAAKALAEKKLRDILALREQAERNRLAETLDADVRRWSMGKEGNLRALLSTLQYILWPESGWQPIPLTDVITAAAVKKAYRKANLCVHPDKVQQRGASIQQTYISEKVFDLLKEAWNRFNSEER